MTLTWDELHLVEDPADDLLRELGYTYVAPELLDRERESQAEPMVTKRLAAALLRLNPWMNEENIARAMRHLSHLNATGLLDANEQAHTALVHHITLEQDLGHGQQSQTVRFIDFDHPERNEFLFTRQYKVQGAKQAIIADMVCFVNGIPLVVIECKSPTINDPIGSAKAQLVRYQELDDQYRHLGAPRLFHTTQLLIATCGQAASYATTGTLQRYWAEWKQPYPLTLDKLQTVLGRIPNPQDVLFYGILTPANLLDLVRNFIVFEVIGAKTIKKLARYQQFIATNKAIERITTATDAARRGGIVWHTQGSGKSLTMVFLAVKLRRLPQAENPTLVVVTDRRDLDDQITGTFTRCGFPNPVQAKSGAHLRDVLSSGNGQTVLTTVQKFNDASSGRGALNRTHNVFVMVDEAHRTQYRSLAARMRRALPHACFLGFTGTPIDKNDRSTPVTFGPYIHTYSIEQAVNDGATVPIYYEMRQSDDRVEGESIDSIFARIFRDYSEDDRDAIKRRYATLEAIAGAPRRIERICLDLIDHFESHIRPNGFKAQLVACNRDTVVTYCETLERLGAPPAALIMSSSNDDDERKAKYRLTKEQMDKLIERFKDPDDPLAILVVCDMLLTGFDAPVEQVMYLDSPLREHNLLQAIARVNRPADNKDYGLVVDYWGVAEHLQDALGIFDEAEVQQAMLPLTDELPRLQSRHRTVTRFFQGVERNDLEACLRVIEPEDRRAEFEQAFRRFSQSLDMVLPDPAALPYLGDLRWLGKLRAAAKVRFCDDRLDLSDCRAKVRAIIEEHIRSAGIDQLLAPVSILAPEFDEQVDALVSDDAKASAMEHAIRHEIHVRLDENPVFFQSLKERLEQLIQERRQARRDAADVLRQYQGMLGEIRGVRRVAHDMGLSETGLALYQILSQPPKETTDTVVAERGPGYHVLDPRKRDMATELLTELESLAVVDWLHKEDVQRMMRRTIKSRLRQAGFDKDQIEALTAQIMELARVRLAR